MAKLKIMVAMSGGVDSSAAAALLKQEGHELLGVTMKLYAGTGKTALKSCCGFGPEQEAKRVAETLGFPHLVLNAQKLFRECVIDDFAAEYAAGRTPNPCVRCNTFLKFGFLLEQARALGCTHVATGHYAVIRDNRLFKSPDPQKDQSYFLYTMTPAILDKILFPVGGYCKSEIREIAKSAGLQVHAKKESQDICFIPRGQYRAFLENRGLHGVKGFMFNTRGEVVGEHEGLWRYTIGQRKGLGPQGKRAYVVAIDAASNGLVIGGRDDLLASGADLTGLTFCAQSASAGETFDVRLRYRGQTRPGTVIRLEGDRMRLWFAAPMESVAPGQSAVLYRGDEVAGGGIIAKKLSSDELS